MRRPQAGAPIRASIGVSADGSVRPLLLCFSVSRPCLC